jgi:hypothetical protein
MYFLTRLQNGCQVKQAVPRQFRCFLSNPDHPVRLVGARVQRSTAADVRTVNAELLRADCNRTAARGAVPACLRLSSLIGRRGEVPMHERQTTCCAHLQRPRLSPSLLQCASRPFPLGCLSGKGLDTVSDLNSGALILRTVYPKRTYSIRTDVNFCPCIVE